MKGASSYGVAQHPQHRFLSKFPKSGVYRPTERHDLTKIQAVRKGDENPGVSVLRVPIHSPAPSTRADQVVFGTAHSQLLPA